MKQLPHLRIPSITNRSRSVSDVNKPNPSVVFSLQPSVRIHHGYVTIPAQNPPSSTKPKPTIFDEPCPATLEPELSQEEHARIQAEDRELRSAAIQARLAKQPRQVTYTGAGGAKKPHAMSELSREKRGWRAADEQAALRAYN